MADDFDGLPGDVEEWRYFSGTARRSDESASVENPHTLPAILGLTWACLGAMALVAGWFVVAFCAAWSVFFFVLGLRWKAKHSGSTEEVSDGR